MKPQHKKVKAWAVLVSNNQTDAGGSFEAFGNCNQFQFPVFPRKKDAREWRNEDRNVRGHIIPVTITYTVPKPTRKK